MSSINVVARERKQDFLVIRRYMRDVDTIQEAMQRRITRVINRKRKIPEAQDVFDLIGMAEMLSTSVDNMEELLAEIAEEFTEQVSVQEAANLKRWLQEKGWLAKESNVIAFNPDQASSYINIVFTSDKAAQEWIDRNPQYSDLWIGKTGKD